MTERLKKRQTLADPGFYVGEMVWTFF